MGTTFRSLLSWNIRTTAVELDPSVPKLFGYFHADGPELVKSPLARVVVDDGRRYLERTTQQYDLITIDPPPPVETAGSSMLYSEEFYAAARRRLRPGGIVEQWVPNGDPEDLAAFARAFRDSFPYVRVFRWGPNWAIHLLGSDRPIPTRSPAEMLLRMPPQAVADLTEWAPHSANDPHQTALIMLTNILSSEWSCDAMIAESPATPPLRDDRPINEYYLLRRGSQDLSETR
jgi:spermidine synthase